MTIKTLEYEHCQGRWKLERTELDAFNLLVGVSGAGKTSVIEALRDVRNMGLGALGVYDPREQYRWGIDIETDAGQLYRWEAEVSELGFVRERITEGTAEQVREIVQREPEEFFFQGNRLPRLNNNESAISLLKDEALLAPLYRALKHILFSETDPREVKNQGYAEVRKGRLPPDSLEGLREAKSISVLEKVYLARLHFHDAFERIRTRYQAIFDTVTDLTVDVMRALVPPETLSTPEQYENFITWAVKHRGSDEWILAPYISSGMGRTFLHLAELELSPPGTTIVIDEYENSMGVNCLPAVTDLFLQRLPELQFILTSHHPYVIENIPMEWWRVVTRHGGTVSVRPARDIPELNTRSRQDAFTLLLNSSVYQEGIQ